MYINLSEQDLELSFLPHPLSSAQKNFLDIKKRETRVFASKTIELGIIGKSHEAQVTLASGETITEVLACSLEEEGRRLFAGYSLGKLARLLEGQPISRAVGNAHYLFGIGVFDYTKEAALYKKIRNLAHEAEKNKPENRVGLIYAFDQGPDDPIKPETIILCDIIPNLINLITIHMYYPLFVLSRSNIIF